MPLENERRPGQGAPNDAPGAGGQTDEQILGQGSTPDKPRPAVLVRAEPIQTRSFLDELCGGVAEGPTGILGHGQLPIWSGFTKRTVWCSTLEAATAALAEGSDRGEHVYHAVALHDPQRALDFARKRKKKASLELADVRGCTESAVVMCGLWSDEDHAGGQHSKKNLPPNADAVLDYLRSLPDELTPSLIVDSGGGFYPWWFYREPYILENDKDRADAAGLVECLQRYIREVHAPGFDHDATWDLARVLRPPGVVNHKYGYLVRIQGSDRSSDDRG
jgi:hypothetical protein